jgi:hypothetical protein
MYPLDKGLLLFTKPTNKCMDSTIFYGKIKKPENEKNKAIF